MARACEVEFSTHLIIGRSKVGYRGNDPKTLNRMSDTMQDFSKLKLKSDSDNRPFWVVFVEDKDTGEMYGRVFLETFSALYSTACDFLITIANPVSRPQFIHEFEITDISLYAAVSLGLDTGDLIDTLEKFSKVELTENFKEFIENKTQRCGKVRLLLKKNRYFLESMQRDNLVEMLKKKAISQYRIDNLLPEERHEKLKAALALPVQGRTFDAMEKEFEREIRDEDGFLMDALDDTKVRIGPDGEDRELDVNNAMGIAPVVDAKNERNKRVCRVEIDPEHVRDVRSAAREVYPLLEEYDFRNDAQSSSLENFSLKSIAKIRPYQEKSLAKMFGSSRARSGIIVLPCGAGKTLVGITAAQTIKKSTLIFCSVTVAVTQWQNQILQWTTLSESNIYTFSGDSKGSERDKRMTNLISNKSGGACVIITTYSMMATRANPRKDGTKSLNTKIKEWIKNHEWGLIILDEVQMAPAAKFEQCITATHSRCKLGLTATLVREDSKIDQLFHLIGPKLYEANWMDLQKSGHIATVKCLQVTCPMAATYYRCYLEATDVNRQKLLYQMNPIKFRTCEFLIRTHEARGDKILVFADNIFTLKRYSKLLNKPKIDGSTSEQNRLDMLRRFNQSDGSSCLFISRIGDNSIDLPECNVLIQIASHFSSRRQEAQRLGRILRPKSQAGGRGHAYFYTLLSKDTKEMIYAVHRQQFLVDQGYSFKIIRDMNSYIAVEEKREEKDKRFSSLLTLEKQDEILSNILSDDLSQAQEDNPDEQEVEPEEAADVRKRAQRSVVSMGAVNY
jgi:DNA excision repair protein ERCC-3